MVLTLTAIKYNILITVTGNELLDFPLQFSFAHWQLSSTHFTCLYWWIYLYVFSTRCGGLPITPYFSSSWKPTLQSGNVNFRDCLRSAMTSTHGWPGYKTRQLTPFRADVSTPTYGKRHLHVTTSVWARQILTTSGPSSGKWNPSGATNGTRGRLRHLWLYEGSSEP